MTTTTPVPEWLNAELFISVLEKNVENFGKIQNFKAKPAFAAGENYLSTLWSIEIEAALKGSYNKNKIMQIFKMFVNFILKMVLQKCSNIC